MKVHQQQLPVGQRLPATTTASNEPHLFLSSSIEHTPNATQMAAVTDKSYTVELMTVADKADVIEFLKTTFFKDEPMNRSLDLGECPELEEWSCNSIKDNCSYKALNSRGEIIGVIINEIVDKLTHHSEEHATQVDSCKHRQFRKILDMFTYVGERFDIFDQYPQYDRALDCKVMSVNDAYRGAGICKDLTRHSIEFMHANGMALYLVMCSSLFSAKVCERLGFKQVFELKYKDYVVNGTNPVLPAEPHDACRAFAKIV